MPQNPPPKFMENASTMNGTCFHYFIVDPDGRIICKECGYYLPLVNLSEEIPENGN